MCVRFNVQCDTNRSFQGRFYKLHSPTNSVKAPNDTMIGCRINLMKIGSENGKGKKVIKKVLGAINTKKSQRHLEEREIETIMSNVLLEFLVLFPAL